MENFNVDETAGTLHFEPTRWQKVSFWSLALAIVVIPLWLAIGRCLMGGPGGWNTILILGLVDPFVFLFHVAIFVVAFSRNRKRDDLDLKDYFVTDRMVYTLLAYCVVHFLLQICMDDGGDQGTMGSVAQKVFQVPEPVAGVLSLIFLLAAAGLLVTLLVLACLEPTAVDKEATRRLIVESLNNAENSELVSF